MEVNLKDGSVLLGHVAEGLNRGERFYIPRKHTVITGMTEYGKTTALETLLHNMPSNVKSLVFLTKRGEKRFRTSDVNIVPPFFKPRYDWRYIRTLLESTMNERLKFETPWIYRVCKAAKVEIRRLGLPEEEGIFVVRNLLGRMEMDEKARDFDKNINTTLLAYMDEFLPVLKENQKTFSKNLVLKPGLNVMDLTPWYSNDAIQMVVIRACMEELLDHGEDTATGLPEAWKNLPQGKNTPVKLLFEKYIREGATNHNYLYIDAQDLGGVDKIHLRQCDVWILGHMKEANEVKRILQQTLGVDIKPTVVQTLPLGHFLVVADDKVTKVYVWPQGIPEEMSIRVAKGELSPEVIKEELQKQQIVEASVKKYIETPGTKCGNEYVPTETRGSGHVGDAPIIVPWDYLERRVEALSKRVDNIGERVEDISERFGVVEKNWIHSIPEGDDMNVTLVQSRKKVKVTAETLTFKMTTEDLAGKIMYLAKEGFLNTWRSEKEIEDQLTSAHGWTVVRIRVYQVLETLVKDGYLGKRKTDRAAFKLADFVTFEEGS